ncbi:MAG: SulP family inorganic anion transporter [Roseibium sp.]|uniref:SulP family inorganic anion transporter n=1 Tax=Roseibium sp. TaxID=1936156 RepID=UPI00260493D8|nr:SulP family inorganic anion transporter [Roseibium sp.]MCV0424176.1 SulP family inorganic anion transporter [Roseibium sp.]
MRDDAIAGFTNAAIVLPQGVAFAVIAGLPPQYGLFTAMITPVIAGIWGSSMIMVSGPTTAISAVMFASLSGMAPPGTPVYVNLALTLTIVAGLFQLAAGMLRLGGLISFISHSVIVGFTAAAALLIAVSQLGGVLGIEIEQGGGVIDRLRFVVGNAGQADWLALMIAASTFGSLILFQKMSRKLPAYLMALVVGVIVGELSGARSAGIAMFSALPAVIPSFAPPNISLAMIAELLPGSATVAFVGLLEAISIGRSFALRRHERYDANQEIIGQGLSNALGGFFQAYAGSGSFTRSALNAESGARTPVSAIFAAAFLLVLLLMFAPFVDRIPVPAMAGIIIYVAWRLVQFREIHHIIENSRSETLILVLTFLTGLLTKLDNAIVVGVIASLCVFLHRSARPHLAVMTPAMSRGRRSMRGVLYYDLKSCPQINFMRLEGPLFFASVEHVESEMRHVDRQFPGRKLKILSMKGMGRMDLAGADLLIQEIRDAREVGGDYHIVAAHFTIVRALKKMQVLEALGPENLHPSKGDAIEATVAQVEPAICRTCTIRAFTECKGKPAPKSIDPYCDPPVIENVYLERKKW